MKKTMDNNNNRIKELEGKSNDMKGEIMDMNNKMMKYNKYIVDKEKCDYEELQKKMLKKLK